MAFTLWNLFEASLLCLNAVCVLHEERFLAKMGWGVNNNIQGFGEQPTIKSQVLHLVSSAYIPQYIDDNHQIDSGVTCVSTKCYLLPKEFAIHLPGQLQFNETQRRSVETNKVW
uniref:Immediate early response 3-interacting protein 1 n=1 Tax=Timema bartmani TaxID=61472 RepID=A0A7R9EZW1_9NEOP|nr:unnamed protein product [Timema bartmani]